MPKHHESDHETWGSVYEWAQQTFPPKNGWEAGIQAQAMQLVAESIELALSCDVGWDQIALILTKLAAKPVDPERIPLQIGGVAVTMGIIAMRAGENPQTLVDDKMKINRQITEENRWFVDPDGVGQLVEVPS